LFVGKVPALAINTLQDEAIELVDSYKYLGIWLDKCFILKKNILKLLLQNLNSLWHFYMD